MTGQEAVHVAEAFAAAVPVTGLVLTKIDGDARGGAALSISAVTGLPVKFLGTGEKTDALEPFHPDRLAGRILGMGDVLTLIERAQETFDEKQAARMAEKLRKNSFTLEDMLEQMEQVQKMGPMGQLIEMIPGLGGMAKQAQAAVDRGDLRRVEAIIRSMTPERTAGAQRPQRFAQAPDREWVGHPPAGRQPARQAIRRASEDDEADVRRAVPAAHPGHARAGLRGRFPMDQQQYPTGSPEPLNGHRGAAGRSGGSRRADRRDLGLGRGPGEARVGDAAGSAGPSPSASSCASRS